MSTERRPLKFDDLDQVIEELNRLLTGGYRQNGNWDLAQTSAHLDDWMRYTLDGYPKAPAPIRLAIWLMKVTSGRRQFENVIKSGFKDKLPTMPVTVHKAGGKTDQEAVEQLTATIKRLKESDGPIVDSPLYGPLTYDEAVQLHLVHCAHHLRLLEPKS